MAKALHIHSVFFDIMSYMGMNEDDSLLLMILAVIMISMWAYLYVFRGYKICLVITLVLCIYFINWMYHSAMKVGINEATMSELSKINQVLFIYTIIYVPMLILVRYLKMKYLDPWIEAILDAWEQENAMF